jgi:periplasmic protein TonB
LMTEMEETDLGLDAEPESASEAPKGAAKVAAADPEMEDLLAAKKLSGAPAPRSAPGADDVESDPSPATAVPVAAASPTARAAAETHAPVVAPRDEPRAASEDVPSPLPQPAPKPAPAAAAAAVSLERAQPEPGLPAPLESGASARRESRDEIELAAIGGSTRGDLSRSPTLAGDGQWDCPFPSEAARAGVDSAIVTLRVEVTADNHIESVIVLRDPGDGFGREARRCALSKRWQAGLDREGRAAQRTTVVSVHFQRKS